MGIRYGNSGSFAKTEINQAWLYTEFGESYARKIFGDAIVDSLPKYVKGKHKGSIKGLIAWKKVVKGGWLTGHGVIAPGKTFDHGLFDAPWGEDFKLLHGVNTFLR